MWCKLDQRSKNAPSIGLSMCSNSFNLVAALIRKCSNPYNKEIRAFLMLQFK
jgi:hypothetical protein